jgi:hypothetical protein
MIGEFGFRISDFGFFLHPSICEGEVGMEIRNSKFEIRNWNGYGDL